MGSGYYIKVTRIKQDAKPIDNVTKFEYGEDDYEEVEEWVECSENLAAAIAKSDKRESFLTAGPNTIAEQDDAICALYEENLALKSTAADQDDAICYLYEQITEGE